MCKFNTWFSNPWSSSTSCPCRIGLSHRFRPVAKRWRCPGHSIWFRFHPRRDRIRCTCMWILPHLKAPEIRVQSSVGCKAVFCCLRIIFRRTIRRRFSNLSWDRLQRQMPFLWLLLPAFPGGSWPGGEGLSGLPLLIVTGCPGRISGHSLHPWSRFLKGFHEVFLGFKQSKGISM